MSYGCSDFVNSCEGAADAYGLPPLTPADFEMLGIDPEEEIPEGSDEGLRALAERVCGAIHDAGKYRKALESIAANTCCGTCREAATVAQEALK